MNIDMKEIYDVITWYADRDKDQSVGLFIMLPDNIAKQFPADGREGKDASPQHITFFYLGDIEKGEQEKYLDFVKKAAAVVPPFSVKLGEVTTFENDKEETILHNPVEGPGLFKANSFFEKVFKQYKMKYSDKFPEYKPHTTIEYVEKDKEPKYPDVEPEGSWLVDHVWIWGLEEPHVLSFKGETE